MYFAAVHKKNNISTSCVLNGFKYILIISGELFFAFFKLILITNKHTLVIHIISWLSILNPDYIRNLIFLNSISTTGWTIIATEMLVKALNIGLIYRRSVCELSDCCFSARLMPKFRFFSEKENERNLCLCSGIYAFFR